METTSTLAIIQSKEEEIARLQEEVTRLRSYNTTWSERYENLRKATQAFYDEVVESDIDTYTLREATQHFSGIDDINLGAREVTVEVRMTVSLQLSCELDRSEAADDESMLEKIYEAVDIDRIVSHYSSFDIDYSDFEVDTIEVNESE